MFALRPICPLLRRTIVEIESRCLKIRQSRCKMACFNWVISSKKHILTLAPEIEIHHIVAARYCGSVREAAALPGRFLPELGRFGNEAAFFHFSAGLLARGGVARAHVLAHAPRDAPTHEPKSLALIGVLFSTWGFSSLAPSRLLTCLRTLRGTLLARNENLSR
jgi:hypothetical protein